MMSGILWDAVNFAVTVFEMAVTYYFFNAMMGLRQNVGQIKNYSCIFIISVILSVAYKFNLVILLIILNIVLRVVYTILFNGNFKTKLFYTINFFIIENLGEIIGTFLLMTLTNANYKILIGNDGDHFLAIVITKLLMLILVVFMCAIKKYKYINISTRFWFILLSAPLLSSIFFVIIAVSIKTTDHSHQFILFVMTVSVIYNYIIVCYLVGKLLNVMHSINMTNLLNQQKSYQLKFYENMRASDKAIKSIRHDLNNHLQCIHDLLLENRLSEAKDYTETVFNAVKRHNSIINTGNVVFDSILNAKIGEMDSENIKFDYTIEIPAGLKVDPVDVCIILGNSLDNSIEACRRIKDGPKRISMIAAYRNKGLILSIKNTADEGSLIKTGSTYETTKDDPYMHGIGISNISRTAEKYGGVVIMNTSDGVFELSAALYNV